ncbi:alkene reductase [Pusillimonas caeni]|uniref:alkene reductase n=1 Tax=Pusillimonas caeni TaxID=1348472 RepID=UPI000E5A0B61|nr:alkene reductase [Pusillimonas caeni]TFL15791.1 alkene reductase [Pusillimonas caeni]
MPSAAGTIDRTALFGSLDLGEIKLPNRIIMAPMSRMRAQADGVPSELNVVYYAQRASAGLIIAEASCVSRQGRGYANSTAIYSDEHTGGWRKVCDAVHAAGGRIVLQLWHVGRISHSSLQDGGALPVAPSPIARSGEILTPNGPMPYETPHALSVDEIHAVAEDYRRAAARAKDAGFDGVEVQCANGFLLEQFLNDGTNHRTDQYGGSMENRSRILFETLEAVCSIWPSGRVGVRLSPFSTSHECTDSNPEALHSHVVSRLAALNLAYLHFYEPRAGGAGRSDEFTAGVPFVSKLMRKHYSGPIIAAGGFDPDSAAVAVEQGSVDAVVFGRHFVSNPDLPARIRHGLTLTPYHRPTFYSGGVSGYTDYPYAQCSQS